MDVENCVAVVTGASSGIGHATAVALAERGARLVLVARDEARLDEVAEACRRHGAAPILVAADVGRREDVERIAAAAIGGHGGFDVWINNAGVTAFGRLDEIPAEDVERLLATNVNGVLLGAGAALRHFRERGRGTLINLSSVVAHAGAAFHSAYVASKWAVRGLGEALQAEIEEYPGIHVCTVMPAFVDTPIFAHAANYTGQGIEPADPVYAPGRVAGAILGLIEKPQDEVFVGDTARLIALGHALAPRLTNRVLRGGEERQVLQGSAGDTAGSLHQPGGSTGIDAGWRARTLPGERFDGVVRGVPLATVAMVGVGLMVALALRR